MSLRVGNEAVMRFVPATTLLGASSRDKVSVSIAFRRNSVTLHSMTIAHSKMQDTPGLETGLIDPTVEEKKGLLSRILASHRFKMARGSRRILQLLFRASIENAGQYYTPAALAELLVVTKKEPAAAMRIQINRLNKQLRGFYRDSAIPAGLWEDIVVEINPRKYFLLFRRNTSSRQYFSLSLRAKTDPKRLLAILVASPLDWFSGELIAGFEKGARQFNYGTLFSTSEDDPEKEAAQISALSKQAAGIAVVPVSSKDEYGAFKKLKQNRKAFVFADRAIDGFSRVPRISSDGRSGGFEATKYLLEECKCDRVFVLSERSVLTIEDRIEGWRQAFRSVGRKPQRQWERRTDLRDEKAGYELMRELSESMGLMENDGVFATNDTVAFGAAAFRARAKWTFDLPIVGFDGRFFGACLTPPIASVFQDFYRMGESAAEVLKKIIQREEVEEMYTVPTRLIKRNSDKFPEG